MKRLTIIVAIILVGVLALRLTRPDHRRDITRDTRLPAIVRLYDIQRDRFFCSAFVVSDSYTITAAHCLADYQVFGIVFKSHPKGIEMRDQAGRRVGAIITEVRYDERSDQGLLVGNFSMFNKLQVVTSPESFFHVLSDSDLTSCGFPYAGKLACSPMKFTKIWNFYVMATGLGMWPGMSGGPLIDLKTGYVIGINTGVLDSQFILATTVNLFENMGISDY